ncbi:hypothetical protein DM02DRAFT_688801 [Periconia macrospinosa]|uniref:ZW10 C-terminal helical domain-containing protein n=1 Tax=Periconia macrospinosa TaxID=97972 RepID=A0A2V1DD54_9PLEO|nr:hypothetical protein DM02DRAFT_688801 [Periconia macrospinosa]
MSAQVSDQQLGAAVLESVQHNSFPQSEHVASAELSPATLPKLLDIVGKAREEKKSQIRQISREAASDVDGWIAQARKLQSDIQRSQETAQEIVKQAESGKEQTAQLQDAASKVSFLHSEIAYNQSLVNVVEQLKDISTLLESAQDAAVNSHIMHALERLEDANTAFKRLGPFQNARATSLLRTKSSELRSAIAETVIEAWSALVVVDTTNRSIMLKEEVVTGAPIHIDTVVDALTKLGIFDKFLTRLSRDMDNVIITPRLTVNTEQLVSALTIEGDLVQINGYVSDMSVKATLEDLQAISEYISTRLPPTIATPLSEKLVPTIATRLINNWLLPAVPLSTTEVPDFQEILSLVLGIVEYFDELGWSGQNRLSDWVDKSADIWLARQKEVAIARVQRLFPRRVQDKKTVERVETQTITKGDALHTEKQSEPEKAGEGQTEHDDDWGADWGEEEPAKEEAKQPAEDLEEEDMSAWGMEEEEPQEEKKPEPSAPAEEDVEDWGADWDDDGSKPAPAEPASKSTADEHSNGKATTSKTTSTEEKITLRETYTVTAIPDSIIDLILQVITDVETLNSTALVTSAITPASGGLYAIPGFLLAMYRATAATHYSRDIAANMLIYNDCTRLSDRLRTLLHTQIQTDSTSSLPSHLLPSVRLKASIEDDIKAIEGFGKRAYGREMESQRTIIRDHLDAAQGFAGCTNMPFASECDNAVMMTIDRISDVKNQWKPVLSTSVLLQSLGSLASTALAKFIADIEDMSDIAEDESRKLHGYCNSLSTLSTLFQTEDPVTGEVQDMAHMYVPNWLKFMYLSEILDSSLADIKYFWTDGELKLEMEPEEVVDLIKALFAESEHRRKAIAEIRRTSLR